MINYLILANIGGSTSGKSINAFLLQIGLGISNLMSYALGIVLVVLIYQSMVAVQNGDTSALNDKKGKMFGVLFLIVISLTARLVFLK